MLQKIKTIFLIIERKNFEVMAYQVRKTIIADVERKCQLGDNSENHRPYQIATVPDETRQPTLRCRQNNPAVSA